MNQNFVSAVRRSQSSCCDLDCQADVAKAVKSLAMCWAPSLPVRWVTHMAAMDTASIQVILREDSFMAKANSCASMDDTTRANSRTDTSMARLLSSHFHHYTMTSTSLS